MTKLEPKLEVRSNSSRSKSGLATDLGANPQTKLETADSAMLKPLDAEALDAISLETVLNMLEVIDSVEDLALLETLTPEQKRQVWDATPDSTRQRLKQLRTAPGLSSLSPSVNRSHTTGLISASQLLEAPVEDLSHAEETAAIDLEAQRQEVDLMLKEPLNLSVQPTVAIGDWVVLHASSQLSKAEMQAIWQVIELQGNYARIFTRSLGSRLYPTTAMALYPRPVELPVLPVEPLIHADELEPF